MAKTVEPQGPEIKIEHRRNDALVAFLFIISL
jgi:hypothetical protein